VARHAGNERTPISGKGAIDLFGESTPGTEFNTLLSKDGPSFPSELDDLSALLTKQGLSKYTDVFLRNEIDSRITLTDEELKEIGIHTQ